MKTYIFFSLFLLTAIHTSAMAVVKERARLPCDVTSVVPEDRIVLILWYRGTTGTPIYR